MDKYIMRQQVCTVNSTYKIQFTFYFKIYSIINGVNHYEGEFLHHWTAENIDNSNNYRMKFFNNSMK